MECRQAQLAMNALVDDELGPDQRARLDRHLQACPSCRIDARRMQRLRAGLDRLRERDPAPAAPPQGVRPPPRVKTVRLSIQTARAAAIVAAAIGLAVFGWRTVTPWLGQPAAQPEQARAAWTPASGVTLLRESDAQYLAVALPSSKPNVRIVRLFEMAPAPVAR